MDEQLLKTLESIEKLIKSSMSMAGNRMPTSADKGDTARRAQGDKEARKSFTAVAATAKNTNDALLGLNKSLVSLTTSVGRTTVGFGSLNTQMAKFMTSLEPVKGAQPAAAQMPPAPNTGSAFMNSIVTYIRAPMKEMSSVLDSLTARQTGKVKQPTPAANTPASAQAAQSLGDLGLQAASAAASLGNVPNSNTPTVEAAKIMGQFGAGIRNGIVPATRRIDESSIPFGKIIDRMATKFTGLAASAGSLTVVAKSLIDIATKLAGDFFQLSRIGLGSIGNLQGLSLSAIQAGMSLKEYTQLVQTNIIAASRSGSLDEFNKLISAADNQLAVMGIFGSEARGLQASLATSNTSLGISQSGLTSAISGQIDTFKQLQKSTLITADEFAGLVTGLSENQDVQKEMLGTAPGMRAAKSAELLQTKSIGYTLGLTGQAAKALGDALIEQRKATVAERIDQMGQIQQLGAFLGQGGQGARIAELNMKGIRRTSAEDAEMQSLAGTMNEAVQQAYMTGNLSTQNVLDQMTKGGGLNAIMDKSSAATLANESGPVANKDFGKSVGEFGQAVGKLLALTEGLKSSVVSSVAAAVGGLALVMFKGPLMALLKGGFGKLGIGGGAAAGAAGGAAGEAAVTGSILSKLMSPITALKDGASALYSSLTNIPKGLSAWSTGLKSLSITEGPLAALKGVFGDVLGVVGSGGSALVNGFKAFSKAFGPAAALVDGIIELVTGEISGALNPSGGFFNRVGGVITAALAALPQLIIDALGFVFGDAFGANLQRGFDMFIALANASVKSLIGKLISIISVPLKWLLPEDSGLVKMLEGATKGLEASADENFGAFDKLWENNSATLKSISKDNKTSADATTKAAEDATTKSSAAQAKFNNVQYDATTAAGLIADAKIINAQPQVQIPAAIVPAPVNTTETPVPGRTSTESNAAAQGSANTDMLTALNNILQVMRDSLVLENRQADNSDELLKVSKPVTQFADSNLLANQLLNRRMV
jgi:hypothetical protein